MSAFTGRQGKGAMKRRREQKRIEAEVRNDGSARQMMCGHVSSREDHPCEVAR